MRSIFWRLNSSFQHLVYAGNNFLSFQSLPENISSEKFFPNGREKWQMTMILQFPIIFHFRGYRLNFYLCFIRWWCLFENEDILKMRWCTLLKNVEMHTDYFKTLMEDANSLLLCTDGSTEPAGRRFHQAYDAKRTLGVYMCPGVEQPESHDSP